MLRFRKNVPVFQVHSPFFNGSYVCITLHKKLNFPSRISSVNATTSLNVTKSAGNFY